MLATPGSSDGSGARRDPIQRAAGVAPLLEHLEPCSPQRYGANLDAAASGKKLAAEFNGRGFEGFYRWSFQTLVA